MFTLSKIFWLIFTPDKLIAFALIAGGILLFTRWWRAGRTVVAVTLTVMVLLGVFPIGHTLVETLENRFPGNPPLPADVAGIVVLGGTVNPGLTAARGQPALTEGGERLTEFVRLGLAYPQARMVFTGGSGSLLDTDLKEAGVARDVLASIGFPEERVILEAESRNTHENAVFTRNLVKPQAGETWVLITSALHMPRAVGCFRAAGWRNIVPYPVDYTTDGEGRFTLDFSPLAGVARLSQASREWIGLVAYRLLGRTDTLYPAP